MTAYVVFTRVRMKDQAEFDIYSPKAGVSISESNATPLAAYGKLEVLEGDPVEGAVIISFPTTADARAWYDGPKYTEAREHRFKGADYNVFIVEGV